MDKKIKGTTKRNSRLEQSSNLFASSIPDDFSVNKFLKSLGSGKKRATQTIEPEPKKQIKAEPQKQTKQEPQNTRQQPNRQQIPQQQQNLYKNSSLLMHIPSLIKFVNNDWASKTLFLQPQEDDAEAENSNSNENVKNAPSQAVNETEDLESETAESEEGALPEELEQAKEDLNEKKNKLDTLIEEGADLDTMLSSFEEAEQAEREKKELELEAEKQALLTGTNDIEDFDNFLKSLEEEADATTKANQNAEQTEDAENDETAVETEQEDKLPEDNAQIENIENGLETSSEENLQNAEITDAEDGEEQGEDEDKKPEKQRRSISKLDYFKYRFLDNSAVGSDGKARVEELATKYGKRREDNAGIIAAGEHGDVSVNYNGEFKQDDFNLDFSKRGSVKIYKTTKKLSVICCIFAFLYLIASIVAYIKIGVPTVEPVTVKSISLNYAGILYQEIDTKLDITGLYITTTYSNKTTTIVPVTYSMITKLPDNDILNSNYIFSATTNIRDNYNAVELTVNGKVTNLKVYCYQWGFDDIVVKYAFSGNITNSNCSQVACWAKYTKIIGTKEITYNKNITLTASPSNWKYIGTDLYVEIPELKNRIINDVPFDGFVKATKTSG